MVPPTIFDANHLSGKLLDSNTVIGLYYGYLSTFVIGEIKIDFLARKIQNRILYQGVKRSTSIGPRAVYI